MLGGHRLSRCARAGVLLPVAVLIWCLAAPGTAGAQDSPSEAQYDAPYIGLLRSDEPYVPTPPPEPRSERSSMAATLRAPDELDLSAQELSEGGLLTILLVALLYLPVMIFNKTTETNHEVISAWLLGPRFWFSFVSNRIPFSGSQLGVLAWGVVAATALFAFVEPRFPNEEGALEYLAGMLIGFTVVSLTFFCTWRFVIHRLEPEAAGHWVVYAPYVLLAAFLVLMARLAHFLPGVVLGTVAEYEPSAKVSERTAGIRVATTYGALLILGMVAWVTWIPVSHAAGEEGAASLTLIADAALAIIFVSALESVAFGLIPMRFLDGHDLFVWNKGLWAAMWGLALFWFADVILHPALSTYQETGEGIRIFWAVVLFSSLMVFALGTWMYFRVREARLASD